MNRARPLAVAAAALLIVGCGAADRPQQPDLTVSAAASLAEPFEQIGEQFDDARVRFQFAGSSTLARQIELGARPSVFAAANTELPARLHAAGLVERPIAFATNRLVIAVASGDNGIDSLDDLARRGVSIAVGSPSVPVGSYTQAFLDRLRPGLSRSIARNIRSEESDVSAVVGKVATGSVDAGFVYATDVKAASGRLRAVELPAALRPPVVYSAAVVVGAPRQTAARAMVAELNGARAQRVLRSAGFGTPTD